VKPSIPPTTTFHVKHDLNSSVVSARSSTLQHQNHTREPHPRLPENRWLQVVTTSRTHASHEAQRAGRIGVYLATAHPTVTTESAHAQPFHVKHPQMDSKVPFVLMGATHPE
jgi:hypothetical protein